MQTAWRIWKVLWRAIVNIAVVIAVVMVLDQTYDRDTRVVLAAIGLLYVFVRGNAMVQSIRQAQIARAHFEQLMRLRCDVNPEVEMPDFTEVDREMLWDNGRVIVNSIGLAAISLTCIFVALTS